MQVVYMHPHTLFHNAHAFMLFISVFKLAVFQEVSTPKFHAHFFAPFYFGSQYFTILTILNQSQMAK
jgi:hypothetical protein